MNLGAPGRRGTPSSAVRIKDDPCRGYLRQVDAPSFLVRLPSSGNHGESKRIQCSSPFCGRTVTFRFNDEVHEVGLRQTMEWNALNRFLDDPEGMLARILGRL